MGTRFFKRMTALLLLLSATRACRPGAAPAAASHILVTNRANRIGSCSCRQLQLLGSCSFQNWSSRL
jgi:hypothetical protein